MDKVLFHVASGLTYMQKASSLAVTSRTLLAAAKAHKMSILAHTSIKRMPAEQLSTLLLSPDAGKVAVVDVRGTDHVGGHIKDSHHVPSTDLDYRMPQIIRTLADKDIVVFHCALSQERGPRAARWYQEEKEKKAKDDEVSNASKQQEVYVLDKGFVGWQEK